MEDVDCLICGHIERRVRFHGRDRLCNVPGEFTLVECRRCGFLYLSPRPDEFEIDRYYPDDYGPYSLTMGDGDPTSLQSQFQYDLRRRCDVVLRHKSGGHLLDVGCGVGDFLAAMRSYPGWHVRGLEPSAVAAERARRKHGVIVDDAYLEQAPYEPASFDVITMWEVLEHVRQPLDTLRNIHRLLRSGGVVVLSVPDRDSLTAKMFGPTWTGLDVPRHFSVFSVTDISRALRKAGFEKAYAFSMRGRLGATHNELLFTIMNLHMWLTGDHPPGRLRRVGLRAIESIATKPLAIIPIFLLTLPYSWLVTVLNRGTQLTVVARKL
jgi:SAM-dependent methyltransferase